MRAIVIGCGIEVLLAKGAGANYYCPHMDANYAKSRLAADRIVLLGLLIVGVLIARLIVSVQTAVEFSDPIRSDYTGVSASMPTSGGWHTDGRWSYIAEDSAFSVGAVLDIPNRGIGGWVRCTYRLAEQTVEPRDRFAYAASRVDGRVVDTGTITTVDGLDVDWAWIHGRQFNAFFGTTALTHNRQLDVELREAVGDPAWAQDVFERVVRSISIEENRLLDVGAEMVSGTKEKGIGTFLQNRNRQRQFLVSRDGIPVGFAVDVMVDMSEGADSEIEGANILYLENEAGRREHATTFSSDRRMRSMQWTSRTLRQSPRRGLRDISGVEVDIDEEGVMTVKTSSGKTRTMRPSGAAVANIVLEMVLLQMLDENVARCHLDVIDEEGQIEAVSVTDVSTEEAAGDPRVQSAFKLEYGTDEGLFHIIAFDSDGMVVEQRVEGEELYRLVRASKTEVEAAFPDRVDLVGGSDELEQMLEQDE